MKIKKLFGRTKGKAEEAAPKGGDAFPPPLPKSPMPPAPSRPAPPKAPPQAEEAPHAEKRKKKKDRDRERGSDREGRHHRSKSGGRHSRRSDTSEMEDEGYAEPKMPVGLGARRFSEVNLMADITAAAADASLDDDGPSAPPARILHRKASAKNVRLTPARDEDAATSKAGNFMQNIHASPLQTDWAAYDPPVFPKTEKDAEFISLSLQRNFVFANALSDEDVSRKREMKQIVDAFESFSVREPGVTILNAGSVGDYFYILREGSVDYKNFDPDGGGKKVKVGHARRPGQSFGELCLLYDCPPPADCVSGPKGAGQMQCKDGGSCSLWRLHKLTFRQIMALRTMRRDERLRDWIRRIEEFQNLDDDFIMRIANALDFRNIKKGETVYRAGDPADEFYVVGSEGKVRLAGPSGSKGYSCGAGEAFGTEAIAKQGARRAETATAAGRTTLMVMSREGLDRTIGSLNDAILLSKDRRLLKSIPLFRDSDFEDFEYELLAALIETVTFKGGKFVYEEEEMVEEPALLVVRSGILEVFSDANPDLERVLQPDDFFGESSLTPDKNMKFGGPKGGTKYRDETVEVVSETVECGKLTLANIDSVILDLHRLGCMRRGGAGGKYAPRAAKSSSRRAEPRPESLSDIEFHHLFGAGTFGRVWIVSRPGGRTAYALKIQSKRELLDQRQASSARRERAVMARLDHPFVCKLVNTFQDDACIYMLLSLVQGGELLNLIQGGEMHGGLPEIATKFYAAGILEGLTYMHRRHILYRDLKPENVLLDGDGYPVIVDFGFSKVVNDKTYTFCGTPLYLAPEIVLSRGHDRAVDYWSLGCLIFEMLFGATPFYERGIDQKGLFKNIVRGKWKGVSSRGSNKLSQDALNLLQGMLEKRPTERLGCLAGGYRDVKHHRFFKEVNFNKLVKKTIKAPWVPSIEDPFDISHFENFDADDERDFTKGKRPLTADEQHVFEDF